MEGNKNSYPKTWIQRGKLKEKETKSVVNFSFDTVFQDKWQLLTSQDSLLIIKDFFKITLLKICIYSFTLSIFQSLFQVNCEVPEYQWPWRHSPLPPLLKHSLLFASNQSAGWLWGQARSHRVISKGLHPPDFSSLDSMQTGSAFTRWGFILLVNDIKYSNDTFWVKYWNQTGYKDPAQKSEHVCTCSAKGHKRAKSFSPKVKIIYLWNCFFNKKQTNKQKPCLKPITTWLLSDPPPPC